MKRSRQTIFVLRTALAAAVLCASSSAFWSQPRPPRRISFHSHPSIRPFHGVSRVKQRHGRSATHARQRLSARKNKSGGETPNNNTPRQQQVPRKEATLRLADSGEEVTLISRTIPVFPNASVTVWERKNSAKLVNAYWEAEAGEPAAKPGSSNSSTDKTPPMLDPFGLVTWPGSVLAARELYTHATTAVRNRHVVVLGAGVGVETQAAALLSPESVTATDVSPTTLQQLALGVSGNEHISAGLSVRTQLLDLFGTTPLPSPCDLLVVADVLYNEELATGVCQRCAEALRANPKIRILVTDSQRFVPGFLGELNEALQRVGPQTPRAEWTVETMTNFEGSGVIIEEDQVYDVTVQSLWIGL